MAPTPEELSLHAREGLVPAPAPSPDDGERVVISGMSGLFPQSHNVKELSDILYNKVNPITNNQRWQYNHPEVIQYGGSVPTLNRFDAHFFRVHFRLGHNMDPMSRKLLEQTYQAIYDAGLNPEHLNGKKISVYTGSCFSETEKAGYASSTRSGLGIAGCSKTMFANRISYWLNAKAASINIDDACCSSLTALEQAYLDITRGKCEAAIVGGASLSLHPQSLVHCGRIITLCPDGKTKSFDQNADGIVKSEAINVLFLQKAKNAKRIYAEVVHAKAGFLNILEGETGPRYGFYRDPLNVAEFFREFYKEAKVPAQAVEYVEAFGSATPEADKAELEAIESVFCKGRDDTLLVGSVMSNIGYSEAASGISAVTKVLLAYEKGQIAANLHCETPRSDVSALREGRMRIVTDHQRFRRTYTAVNGTSVTGVNAHVLLRGRYKPKDPNRYKSSVPHLVVVSGRQDTCIRRTLDDLTSKPIDPEEIALLHNIHSTKVVGHIGRGYTILDTNEDQETKSLVETIGYFDGDKRPLWFVYSGMGSQWSGMGTQLMRMPIFAAAIERCRKVLDPKGLDIVHIITSPDKDIFNNILHSFVGIAAIQIGLTDILTSLGLVPDKIIGHSVGELACAYADGCLTAEEMILSSYSRGMVSIRTPFIRGSMAAVGIGYREIVNLLPPEIEVACHNGPQSSTISGPTNKMREFVEQLTAKGIFAKEVPCSNIAYHSRYIAHAGPDLLKYLKEVIKNPKPRSGRWLSTSVAMDRWDEPASKISSAEYHTNNLLGPVLFEETCKLVPADAVLVEIGPHGLLQAILKRSLPVTCRHIPLTRRGHPDNAFLVLNAIGKLYMEGYIPKVEALYPKVEFPVSTGTPMLSHLVEWVHQELWHLPFYMTANRRKSASCKFVLSIHEAEHQYLKGHVIKGQNLYPFSAALVAVWDTLAMSLNMAKKQLSVQFLDVNLYAQPVLHDRRNLILSVALHRGTGRFEILDDNRKVATGYVMGMIDDTNNDITENFEQNKKMELKSEDVYKLLYLRDYFYHDDFRTIHKANLSLTKAQIVWNNNWVTFIDGVLQLHTLRHSYDGASQPSHIRRMCIHIDRHAATEQDGTTVITANVLERDNIIRCGGVMVEDMTFKDLPPMEVDAVTLTVLKNPSTQSKVNKQSTIRRVTLRSARFGDVESLHWVQTRELSDGDGIAVNVYFAAINNIDAKRATGEIPLKNGYESDSSFGMDFSGTTDSGDQVMGMVPIGSVCGRVDALPQLLWPVPKHWSLEDAATVPSAYALAFYCLALKCNIRRGLRVLVHGGAGALGQAAISISLAIGCEVFTTVSDVRKKRFLLRLFPELKDDHIGNSRDRTFGDTVGIITKGYGVDVILSCLKGELKNVTMESGAQLSQTFDVAHIPNKETFNLGMSYLNWDRNYVAIDLNYLFMNVDEMKRIQALMSEGISQGYVRPLSHVTYAPNEVSRAFRLLAASRHRGRVLLRMGGAQTLAHPRLTCSPNRCHLLLCNEEPLALQWVDRLIHRGARKFLVHYENMPTYLHLKVRSLQKLGVEVKISSEDLRSSKDITTLLSESNSLGVTEGIYVIASGVSDETKNNVNTIVANLDTCAREMCSSLRYFTVVNSGVIAGQKTCFTRARDNLPTTILYLPPLRNVGVFPDTNSSGKTVTWRTAVDAIEQAINSSQTSLLAQSQKVCPPILLEQIAQIAELNISENTLGNVSLADMGIEATKMPAVSCFLSDVHNLSFDEDTIADLTIQEIRDLEETMRQSEFKEVRGLEMFFSYIDNDELFATTDLVFLPTLTNSASMRDDEFDVSQTYLSIVPGLEGHHRRFRVMCERLKLPAIVLQSGFELRNETIREKAERFAKTLLKKVELKDNFYLLGYESGVLVALEIVNILEAHGLTGTLFCVGGTPQEIQAKLEEQLGEYVTEQALQDAVIRHMLSMMTGHTEVIDEALGKASSWHEKIEACLTKLLGKIAHSAQFTGALIKSSYTNVKQTRAYNVEPKAVRSRLVLLHASDVGVGSCPASLLQRYSRQPVVVHELRAPLAHCTQDLRCSAIINKHLDQEILNSFEERNLCESYLVNGDEFMTLVK